MPPRKRSTTTVDDELRDDELVDDGAAVEPMRLPADVVDYDSFAADRDDDEYPPFRFKLGGELRELPWPLASTRRAIQTAVNETRVEDVHQLLFGAQWPKVSQDLDDLGPAGDEAGGNLVLDAMEHFGMSQQAQQQYAANRQQRREQRQLAARRRRKH